MIWWGNPHKSVLQLGTGNYDINVLARALLNRCLVVAVAVVSVVAVAVAVVVVVVVGGNGGSEDGGGGGPSGATLRSTASTGAAHFAGRTA
jgi:hypothetical protein